MKVAVITGCTQGIGYATALRLSEAYHIVGCARTPLSIQNVRQKHPTWDLHVCDLSDKTQVYTFAGFIRQHYPAIDVLINNAGQFMPGSFLDEPDEAYELMIKTNLSSAYYLTKALLPVLIAQRRGLIINIASVASIVAYPTGSAYSIAKAGLLSFSRNLREQLKPYSIGVTAMLLGATLTRSWEGSPYPPERFIPPEAVADLIWSFVHLPSSLVVEEIVIRPMLGDIK
ncbi:MAG: SDR family oxidoreductase [Bacteroidia bacterium]|nr:SDR family oxidoreductase [Bacteroidia bacterium]MDW8014644.1 SDR family oxidoreductase [Bacteroidia bacterium]